MTTTWIWMQGRQARSVVTGVTLGGLVAAALGPGLAVTVSPVLAPVVLADKCVGCGLCQARCYAINVKEKKLLKESAIIVEAGPGKEDRMCHGSYIELRKDEQRKREAERKQLMDALRRNDNNRSKTALYLGISRVALYKRLHKLQLL